MGRIANSPGERLIVSGGGGGTITPTIVGGSSPYSVGSSDTNILVRNTTGSAFQVNMPAPGTNGRLITITDDTGNAGTLNITASLASGTFNTGNNTFKLTINFQSITFLDNTTTWTPQ